MNHRITKLAALMILGLSVLAGCGDATPPPEGDPPILTGFDSLPKEIATIEWTPTPTPVLSGGQTVNVAQPSVTPAPPRPTATMTSFVGIFMGEPTSESGETAEPIATLAPYVFNPGAGGNTTGVIPGASTTGGACSMPVATTFSNAYNTNANLQQRLGCPVNGGTSVSLVTQPFERGNMYWRDTRQIYVLSSSSQFWQIADTWQEGMPADDPAFAAPGGMLQPVRGFGLAWRSNQAIRDALGWATLPEAPFMSTWQDFERGAMFVGNNNLIYAIFPAESQHSGPLSP